MSRLIALVAAILGPIALGCGGGGARRADGGDGGCGVDCDAPSCPFPAPRAGDPCPVEDLDCEYALDAGRVDCTCSHGNWSCLTTTCPDDLGVPSATCTPGATCGYREWFGCTCVCSAEGHWGCTPESPGGSCPV